MKNATTNTATYSKLRDGTWGIRVPGTVQPGQSVRVIKRSGEAKTETVARVLWTDGSVSLCSIGAGSAPSTSSSSSRGRNWDPTAFNGYGAPRGAYRRACKTDGNCSSFGTGKSCGGHDCDGY